MREDETVPEILFPDADTIPEILLPKVDVVFKMLFGSERNIRFLESFLGAVLGKKVFDVKLLDSKLRQETEEDKLGILDIKARLENGEVVDIEIQVRPFEEMRKRVSFYSSGMITEQLRSAGKYSSIKPAISIIIVAKTLVPESKKCHNVFKMLEVEEHFPFDDLQQIHILDLSRIDREIDELLSDWLSFINGEKKEDFMVVAAKNDVIREAFNELKVISADDDQRRLYESRLKLQRDNWARQDEARDKGRKEERQEILALFEKGLSLAEMKEMIRAKL